MTSPSTQQHASLDMPHYGIGPRGALKRFFAKYFVLEGRASRSEYWWVAIAYFVIFDLGAYVFIDPLLDSMIDSMIASVEPSTAGLEVNDGSVGGILTVASVVWFTFALVTIIPMITVTVRRLHDAGYSGWLFLISLVPWIGQIVVFIFAVLPSSPHGERYDSGSGYNSLSRSSSGEWAPTASSETATSA